MKRPLFTLLALLSIAPLLAQGGPPAGRGPGAGKGHGGGGPGGGGGPMSAEAMETIHTLFAEHKSIERKVTLTKTGYKSVTTSKDPKLVAKIQEHVAAMETRLDSGFPVRRWDPAYEEFFKHYKDLEITIKKIKNGVQVEAIGKNADAVKVAQNHAKIISGFVKIGESEHHAKHPAALGDPVEAAKAAEGEGGCKDCKGACKCQAGPSKK
jgi:hypothetical protein